MNTSQSMTAAPRMACLNEYLRLGPQGATGWNRTVRLEAYPKGNLRHQYRTHPDSEFACPPDTEPHLVWNEALVIHKGLPRKMFWTPQWTRPRLLNPDALRLLLCPKAQFIKGDRLNANNLPVGDVFFMLKTMLKPYADIRNDHYTAHRFEKEARPLFTGWWRAVRIKDGMNSVWRVFCDNSNELVYAKLVLSS